MVMKRRWWYGTMLAALCILTMTGARDSRAAEAQVPGRPFVSAMFGDGMVLQRGRPVPLWGWTAPGAQITVTAQGKRAVAVARPDGYWKAELPALTVGKPFDVAVMGPQTVTYHDVLAGDVWVCSGQSNMEFGIGNVTDAAQEIAGADYPQIRLFKVAHDIALEPNILPGASWVVCSPQTVKQGGWNGFSAVGYFFGRDLYQTLHVPIGLIESDWGGTPAEAWASADALATLPDFQPALAALKPQQAALPDGTQAPGAPQAQAAPPQKFTGDQNSPTVLFNGMIHPLLPYAIKGAIWYQGESNAGRAFQYRTLLPAMINDWRTRWGEGAFPFYIVQLANYTPQLPQPGDSDWAELREAQSLTAKTLPNSGIAVTIDIGAAGDIHPKDKQDVGRRLSLVALAQTYGQKVEYSGPQYQSIQHDGSAIRLTFSHLGGGLVAKGGPLTGFAVAGADHKFVWADAVIEGGMIRVSAPTVPDPVAVRYAWATNPACNLYNAAGLPASPFRTDDWPGVTVGRK